jgi:hypothetical protein
MDRDCSFNEDVRWFRYRAAAIILHAGKVLMARNEAEPYFSSIGGGVHRQSAEVDQDPGLRSASVAAS